MIDVFSLLCILLSQFSLQPYFITFRYTFFFSLMGTRQVYLICLSFLVSDIPCGGHDCTQQRNSQILQEATQVEAYMHYL